MPIINPLWFYLIDLSERVSVVSSAIGIIFAVLGGILVVSSCDIDGDINFSKSSKIMIIVGIILFVLGGLIPSKEASYKMMISSYLTSENIDFTKNEIIELIDYIIDKVNQIQ